FSQIWQLGPALTEPPAELRNSLPPPPETTACMPFWMLKAPWLSKRLPVPSRWRIPVVPMQHAASKLTLTLPRLTTLPVSWRSPRQQPVVLMLPVLVRVSAGGITIWAVPPQASLRLRRLMVPALVMLLARVAMDGKGPGPEPVVWSSTV